MSDTNTANMYCFINQLWLQIARHPLVDRQSNEAAAGTLSPPAGLPEDNSVETPAFTDAVRRYRQDQGHYGTWDMMCGNPPQVRASAIIKPFYRHYAHDRTHSLLNEFYLYEEVMNGGLVNPVWHWNQSGLRNSWWRRRTPTANQTLVWFRHTSLAGLLHNWLASTKCAAVGWYVYCWAKLWVTFSSSVLAFT